MGASDRGEAKANEGLLEEHEHLSQEARVQASKLELMHVVDWEQTQEVDVALARCHKWLHLRKGMPPPRWLIIKPLLRTRLLRIWKNILPCSISASTPRQDTLLRECLGVEAEMEQGKMFFHIHNSLVLSKGLMYINTSPKGETEGVLAFIVPVAQRHMARNGVHQDAGHQGQQRTLALTQERFWWPMMVEDC